MKYYAVIDTNVVVSSMLKTDSVPGKIVEYVKTGTIIPLLNDEIINEYGNVLRRNKFDFSEKEIEDVMNTLCTNSIFLGREQTKEEFVDKDDIVFFEIVMTARQTMEAYLVSGNLKHYPRRSYIVSPSEMLEIIESNKAF